MRDHDLILGNHLKASGKSDQCEMKKKNLHFIALSEADRHTANKLVELVEQEKQQQTNQNCATLRQD
ncbi:hypothetical protein RRG08_061112 [Elysia crispata]|uniref:Uncharacterized protein n=1 Tax=Elysia crispata TaxID=231223 RepID=A0AAE0Z220_9GAST|nr:hypothetical protein RRG08_061108 [Elysia crispata]KAK3776992.1 hypothetical protein RRG08_061112 [Elysia crispata]